MNIAWRLLSPLPYLLLLFVLFSCNHSRPGKPRVLIFSKGSVGGASAVAPIDLQALQKLAEANEWLVDTTSDSTRFLEDSLKLYSAVVFLNTPGNVLDHYGQADLERYIQAGGGYAGVRSATTSKYEWGWYRRMIGVDDSSRKSVLSHEYEGGRAWYMDSLPPLTDIN